MAGFVRLRLMSVRVYGVAVEALLRIVVVTLIGPLAEDVYTYAIKFLAHFQRITHP